MFCLCVPAVAHYDYTSCFKKSLYINVCIYLQANEEDGHQSTGAEEVREGQEPQDDDAEADNVIKETGDNVNSQGVEEDPARCSMGEVFSLPMTSTPRQQPKGSTSSKVQDQTFMWYYFLQ